MSYERSTWVKGDVISSARLNNMENGILRVSSAVDNLNYTDTSYTPSEEISSDFVSKIVQSGGQITVEHTKFSPVLTLTPGTSDDAPKYKITVAGNDSSTEAITKADTNTYGVTKLNSNTVINNVLSNDERLAVTANGVKNAIESLDVTIKDNNSPELGQSRTLASLTETDGKIAAIFQDIYINSAHITDSNGANQVVKLNEAGIIPSNLLPSYIDDVLIFDTYEDFPWNTLTMEQRQELIDEFWAATESAGENSISITDFDPDDSHTTDKPETGKIYIAADTGYSYRWYDDGAGNFGYALVGVSDLNYLDDGTDSHNGDAAQGTSFGAANTKFVSSVIQNEGKIKVIHRDFAPSAAWVAATTEGENPVDKPRLTISIAGSPIISDSPNIADTNVYGITKLSNALDSSSTEIAASSAAVKVLKDNIDGLNNNDENATDTKFVSSVTQSAGQITVNHRDIAPALSLTAGTIDNAPKINISVANNSMQNPIELTKATVGTNGIYGVTKLSSSYNSDDDTIAATPKAVKDAIDSLDIEQITNTAGKTISTIDEANGKISAQFQDIQITPDQIKDVNNHPLTEWEDITSQCTILPSVNAAKVYINRALKLGYFMYNAPSGTANGAQIIKLNPLGNMKLGQYFNSRMDGSMLIAAEIPDKSKTIVQNHSANSTSTKSFGASGMFMYRDPVNHTLTINYTSADNQFVAPATYTDSVEEFDTYSHASPVITYFTSDIATVTGEMGEENVSTTVTYTRSTPTLTVNYVDASDNTVLHAAASSTKPAGLEYTINAESIEHFTPTAASITNTMPDHNDSKTFTYNRITHTLTINYVNGNGAVLETAYTATVGEALTYNVESPIIEGYSTIDPVVSGTMGNADITIDVVYTEI